MSKIEYIRMQHVVRDLDTGTVQLSDLGASVTIADDGSIPVDILMKEFLEFYRQMGYVNPVTIVVEYPDSNYVIKSDS